MKLLKSIFLLLDAVLLCLRQCITPLAHSTLPIFQDQPTECLNTYETDPFSDFYLIRALKFLIVSNGEKAITYFWIYLNPPVIRMCMFTYDVLPEQLHGVYHKLLEQCEAFMESCHDLL